jgi:dipeptidyl aminopeptidase/acylaminoacyl peptidase
MGNSSVLQTLIKLKGWVAVLLAVVFIGGMLTTAVNAQESDIPQLTVVAPALNVRSGPDLSYPAFETLPQGRIMGVIGYNAETGWWQIVSTFGSPGWVSGGEAYVSVNQAALQRFAPVSPQAQTVTPVTLPPPVGIMVFQTASSGAIYAINQDGTNLHYLTTGMDPALSPDGQWVAFTRWETSQDGALGNVWVINVDGTGERVIHENLFNPRTPVWSSDGSQLVISFQQGGRIEPKTNCTGDRAPRNAIDVEVDVDDEGNREVCYTLPPDPYWGLRLIDVATGANVDLPKDTYSLSPSWDPLNSQHLIFNGNYGLMNLDLVENKISPFAAYEYNDHSPVYSPDGSRIAVSYWQSDHWEVHVLNADGSGRTRLTETSYMTWVQQELNGQLAHSYNNAAPVWSPDGTQLAFLTDRTGQWEIWVMNADGTNQRPMFPAGTLDGIPLHYNGTDDQPLAWR